VTPFLSPVHGYQHGREVLEVDDRTLRHSLLTTVVVLGVGLVYVAGGFLEIRFRPRGKKKGRGRSLGPV
jgi:hypothetical protein